ncbi:hypothetical protein KDL01_39845 [Actinospica durhamensis]|uniref:Uncharacterized protein n=1 Tax=Actinospica durhamensis TaxID=1508375 RepID=A0A941EWI7_9ACTN|nr:hypothetical protein [Actinospica durhamensis]MBR7839477.1 hypothetical protein [Actinospica durhamensis]
MSVSHDAPRTASAPTDLGESYDPFRATKPAVLVHDAESDVFERAWEDRATRCPQCHRGTAKDRGASAFDHRRWVRFSCGDVIGLEQTAG